VWSYQHRSPLARPLAELVKIDPKSIGVGQYQHDVDQKLLKKKLDETVESCVNYVGVDLNTASKELLALSPALLPPLQKKKHYYLSETKEIGALKAAHLSVKFERHSSNQLAPVIAEETPFTQHTCTVSAITLDVLCWSRSHGLHKGSSRWITLPTPWNRRYAILSVSSRSQEEIHELSLACNQRGDGREQQTQGWNGTRR